MSLRRLVLPALIVSVAALTSVVKLASANDGQTASPVAQQNPPAVLEIAIKAKKYDFTPNKIEIPLNTTVKFVFTAEDRSHGFEIEGVKDSCVKFDKGETKSLEYKATKAGTFNFKCCDRCGLGHGGMKGTFTVK
jgi:cytochrome c oxidase subunit 2